MKALCPLGEGYVTAGAQRAAMLLLHVIGDFGCIDPESVEENKQAIRNGERILSAYPILKAKPCAGYGANTIWLITEADRSRTTFLLPEEY